MRVLFYGTPAFAVPTLDALLGHHDVVAVVTQPDRPAGRGQRLEASPVKRRALDRGVPVLQPTRLRDRRWPSQLASFGADVAVVAAFGQILPPAVLAVPRRGSPVTREQRGVNVDPAAARSTFTPRCSRVTGEPRRSRGP